MVFELAHAYSKSVKMPRHQQIDVLEQVLDIHSECGT
jgi:hypothetical protein